MTTSSLLTRRPQIPAWTISTVVHALLMLLLLLWASRLPQGGAEETLRDAGIVLKRTTAAGVQFDGEAEVEADRTADVESSLHDLAKSLPDMATHSTASEALPTLPGPGMMAGSEGTPSASAMAAGGGTRGGARDDIGEKTTTEVFGVKGTGTKFVYVFDRSGSMIGPPLAAAKQQLIASIESLEEIHQFHVIFFNHAAPRHMQLNAGALKRIPFADSRNKMLASRFISEITANGGTEREAPLLEALDSSPDVIFFLTDADNEMSRDEIDNVVRKSKRSGTMICTIEFGRGPDPRRHNFLFELAHRTGGEDGYVDVNALQPASR